VNKITLRIFNKPDTIGEFANNKIEELRKEFEKGANKEAFIERVKQQIGESVERVLFINEILDSKKK